MQTEIRCICLVAVRSCNTCSSVVFRAVTGTCECVYVRYNVNAPPRESNASGGPVSWSREPARSEMVVAGRP